MSHDSYYAYQDAKEKWLKDNPEKTEHDWTYAGTDVQDVYVEPEMAKRGYTKGKYLGMGAWQWHKND